MIQIGMEFVHLGTERHRAFVSDLVTGLDPDAVEFRMAEETHVHADGHAGDQHIIAVRAEERAFGFIQTDRMHERANQVFLKAVLIEIFACGRIDLASGQTDFQHVFGQAESLAEIFHAFDLFGGILAVGGKGIADHTGITAHFRGDADHDQFAVLHDFGRGGRDHGVAADAAADRMCSIFVKLIESCSSADSGASIVLDDNVVPASFEAIKALVKLLELDTIADRLAIRDRKVEDLTAFEQAVLRTIG